MVPCAGIGLDFTDSNYLLDLDYMLQTEPFKDQPGPRIPLWCSIKPLPSSFSLFSKIICLITAYPCVMKLTEFIGVFVQSIAGYMLELRVSFVYPPE